MKKRILSLALAFVMALTLIPAALAADKPERGVIHYSEPIAPQYEDAQTFSEDLAAVKKAGKWGYIDHDNKVVIPFQYELAYRFSEGYAVVAKSARKGTGEWDADYTYYEMGFIDKAGNYTPFIEEEYSWGTGEFTPGNLEVNERSLDSFRGHFFWNGYCYIDNGLYRTDGSYVHLARDGSEFDSGYLATGPVTEGLVPVIENIAGWAAVGWADPATGKVVKSGDAYDDDFYSTYPFNKGYAVVQAVDEWVADMEVTTLYGIMDRNFQWVIEPQFDNYYWHDSSDGLYQIVGDTGLAMVSKNGKFGAIDMTGAVKIPFEYERLLPVSEGLIAFTKDGKAGFLDAETLTVAIPAQYENVTSFENGLAVASDGTKAFLIDWKGNPVPGADKLRTDTYLREDDEDGSGYFATPGEYVVIEENGKYGYGHVEYLPNLPEKDEMSDWAYEEVTAAIEENLIPVSLQNLYRSNIKRSEFCDVIIQAMEAVLDKDIEEIVKDKTGEDISDYQHSYPFVDTAGINTLAANKLGIVNGKGDGIFDPYANITRQEAAAMLMRAAKVLEMENDGSGNTAFTDSSQVAAWAVEAVEYICKAGIMNGKGDAFDPTGTYSREQSYMTIYRLFQRVVGQ